MHDPMVVAHVVVRPWPRGNSASANTKRWVVRLHHDHMPDCAGRGCTGQPFPWWKPRSYSRFWRIAGRDLYWPPLITVWHVEPKGHDSGSICPHYRRWQDEDGKWRTRTLNGWKWHLHHWKIQVHLLQTLRRSLLTRCEWCHGRSRKGDMANHSHQWDSTPSPWWRGERGLFHRDCSAVEVASRLCLCTHPLLKRSRGYGQCLFCGKYQAYGKTPDDADRLLASLPAGSRITPEVRAVVEPIWAERRARKSADGTGGS